MSAIDYLVDGPSHSEFTLALAHGAGAPMDSPFMAFFSSRLADAGVQVVRFEFPYMVNRRATGTKKPPDRQPVLLDTWRKVIDELGPEGLVIGGKSMGGRMASLIADDERPRGLVCLGYPFYPPGRPEKTRLEHLREIETPTLICQGSRDAMGNREAVGSYDLSPAIRLHWLEDGDHSFKPRKASGRSEEDNWESATAAIIGFLGGI